MVKLATFRNVSSPKFSIQKYEKISKEECFRGKQEEECFRSKRKAAAEEEEEYFRSKRKAAAEEFYISFRIWKVTFTFNASISFSHQLV